MKNKFTIVMTIPLSLTLIGAVCYLKFMPLSFVRIYYTSELEEFNKPPTKEMTVALDGYVFNYHIPHNLSNDYVKEARGYIHDADLTTLDALIKVTQWVRSKLKFGMPNYNSDILLVEDILNNLMNNDTTVFCDSYARLFVIVCQSLGIPARIVELEGHVVPEAFVRRINKWVMIDPSRGYYMSRSGDPLSVVEVITYYKKNIRLTPTVFAKDRSDDSLYKKEYETKWKEAYLNGHTVVSDMNRVDIQKIINTILQEYQLPIVKIQFLNDNSTLIGYKEKIVRYIVIVNFIVLIILMIVIMTGSSGKRHSYGFRKLVK